MAEEILFGIAGEIILQLGELAVKEIGLIWGVKTELLKLKETILTIRAVLLDAEEKQANAQVKIWLEKLADAVYDADTVVDEFRYRLLRRRLVFGNKRAKKVRIFFSRLNQVFFRTKMARGIKKIRKTLDKIQANRSFHLVERLEDTRSFMRPAESYSFVITDEVIGRNDDKKAIIELLLSDFETKKNVSTIAIVGIGGLGKTTLAQLIFNDEEVKKCFQPKAWVCVSDVFDVKLLVQKIVRSVGGTSPDQNLDLEQLQTQLRSHIEGKKYLLVLDDVWNENSAEWDKLAMLLQSGARGSRILITTRSEKVATATRTTLTYQLRGLDEGKSLYLFRTMAFEEGKQPADNWGLSEIEREIVDKCKGVPLAIKSIATLLRSRLILSPDPEKEWKLFKESELAEIANEDESDIIPTLRLSYKNLPSHLKHCFAFCRLFPKDHEIDVAKLIRLWIAQGFIKPSENRQLSLEDVGREYFVDLLWRSFFQEAIRDGLGNIRSCKMHDLIHDLAISVAGKSIITLDQSKDNTQRMGSSGSGTNTKNVRHAYADFGMYESCQIPAFWLEEKKLRSLALSSKYFVSNLDVVVSNFKFLRSLTLVGMKSEIFPDKVGELIHLRYLDLKDNDKIKVLPDSITRLHHLETLILEGCSYLERLPQDMKKLVNLRHLELTGCRRLTHTPRGIGELTSLQTLSLFKVVDDNNDQLSSQCARLGELSGLNNLHGKLWIDELGHQKDVASESKAAKLKDKEQLQSLYLSWRENDVENIEIVENDGMALDGFQPAQSLKALRVENYMGLRISDWLSSLTRLVRLDLNDCEKCQYIPPLHQLSSLQILKLDKFDAMEYISEMDEDEFSASMASSTSTNPFFPSLKQLEIHNCKNLKGWWRSQRLGDIAHHKPGTPSFPNLSYLQIWYCHQLTSMPLFPNVERVNLYCSSSKPLQQTITSASSSTSPSKLSDLEIDGVDDVESLLELIDSLSSLKSLKFQSLHNLRVLPEELGKLRSLQTITILDMPSLESLPEGMSNLSSLQSLFIVLCTNLESLPNGIGNLSSLQSLSISGCSNLTSLPSGLGNISSLQVLQIQGCPNLTSLPSGLGNLSSLRSLHIRECPNLTSLPSGLGNLSSLQSLRIVECPNLTSLPSGVGNILNQQK